MECGAPAIITINSKQPITGRECIENLNSLSRDVNKMLENNLKGLEIPDRMRELEATGEHTTAEINAMVRGGKLRGHIPGVGRFADAFARYDSGGASGSGGSRARDREDGDDTGGEDGGDDTNFFRKKSGNAAAQAVYKKKLQTFPQRHVAGERRFPSDMSLGKILPPWHQFLDQKIRGAHFCWGLSLENVLPSSLPHQLFPSDISLGICFPSDMSLAKGSECCWGKHRML
ncbi:hypothetical protein Tco_0185116 [Tanacetum coccineum]